MGTHPCAPLRAGGVEKGSKGKGFPWPSETYIFFEGRVKMSEIFSLGLSNTEAQNTSVESGSCSDNPKIRLLLDWLGFSVDAGFTDLDIKKFFKVTVGIEETDWLPGRRYYQGYADSWTYENINIYYNGAENQGLHVDITGQGCRFIETFYRKRKIHKFDWLIFFSHIIDSLQGKFTRIDMAIDEFEGYLDVQKIFEKCLKGEVRSRFKSWRPDGNWDMNGSTNGITIYFGSVNSRMNVIFYEKNKQLNIDYHWSRMEVRYKKQRAQALVKELLYNHSEIDGTKKDVAVIVAAHVRHYLKFVDQTSDSNKARWPESQFWKDFMAGVPSLRLAEALPDRTITRIRSWFDHQVSKSFALMFYAYQDTEYEAEWLREILNEGRKKLKESDKIIIDEFKRMMKKESTDEEKNDENEKIKKSLPKAATRD